MSEQLFRDVEGRLGRLEASVADLEDRVRLLEAGSGAGERTTAHGANAYDRPLVPGLDGDLVATASLVGRFLLVAAGAYLLRALTDGQVVPAAAGVVVGLFYAGVWAVAADRAAAAGQRLGASFHAAATVAIAYPVLWEAQVRFGLPSPSTGAVALAVVTAGLLMLAWRRYLHGVAWLVTVAGLAASMGVMLETGAVAASTVYLIALGVGTLWLGYVRGWIGLRWPVAIAADVAVLGATARALRPVPLDPVGTVLLLQVLLPTAYLSTIAARTLWLGRPVIPFEVVQAPLALAVGLGGALAVTHATGLGQPAIGVVALALGCASYGVAFAFADRRQPGGTNFYFYTSLALALILSGTCVLVAGDGRSVALAAVGIASAWASRRYRRLSLTTHAAAALVLAAVVSGALATSAWGLFGWGDVPPGRPSVADWSIVLAAALSLSLAPRPDGEVSSQAVRAPRVALAGLVATCLGGLLVAAVAPWLGSVEGNGLAPASLAALRSGVLGTSALVLAAVGRRPAHLELRWLVYPVLAAGGLKLLLQDFRVSPPSMLVVALGVYGTALIVAPRLCRRAGHEARSVRGAGVETEIV